MENLWDETHVHQFVGVANSVIENDCYSRKRETGQASQSGGIDTGCVGWQGFLVSGLVYFVVAKLGLCLLYVFIFSVHE